MVRDHAALLPRILAKLFPDRAMRESAERVLGAYGRSDLEKDRVHLGILRIAGADLDAIERWTRFACVDYRDLLVQAEYPLTTGEQKLLEHNPEKYAALAKKERDEYDEWIAEVLAA